MPRLTLRILAGLMMFSGLAVLAQEKSVKPGINDSFKNPDVEKYQKTFEGESREVFVNREKLVAACKIKPGMVVADIGAGTGLHTRLFAKEVGSEGQVYAVDIAAKFLEHIQKTSREAKLSNVTPVLCNFDSVDLPRHSVDVAFVCDAYHHFEFPQRTLASLYRAIKPEGRLVIVDFKRIEGVASEWTMKHVRAGQETVEKEITEAGFKKTDEVKDLLKDNYMVVFTRTKAEPKKDSEKKSQAVSPAVPGYGAVVPLSGAVEPPDAGSKLVIDITATGKDRLPPPGLVRAATMMNLAVAAGQKVEDIKLTVVLHGDATLMALNDEAYLSAAGQPHPTADLLKKLQQAGVQLQVCGQSLARKGLDAVQVRPEVTVAVSAVSSIVNHQSRGYAYIPAH